MSIDEQPMNIYWSGQKSPTSNKYKINYKGTVATASALPTTGNKKGDTYNISEDGSDYIWTGTEWNKFGANIYVGATDTASGIQGLVPVATSSQMYSLLTGMGTWQSAEDLGLALNSDIVHKTGNEIIDGKKTFTGEHIAISPNSTFYFPTNSRGPANNDGITIVGGTTYYKGARIRLYGSENSDSPGTFILVACTSNSSSDQKWLIGRKDGTLTWDGQDIQISSDKRIKTALNNVSDDVLDAWGNVQWGQFRYLDAVQEKGEAARLHLGLIAQQIKTAFEERGLNACHYGILCHEEHEATKDLPAVDLWMVRYAEAQAMEAVYQRRRAERAEARIKALEDRLSALEAKLG